MKKLRIWYMAVFQDWPFYRVLYSDGQKTYPLTYRHAKPLKDLFGGRLFLDYKYGEYILKHIGKSK